MAGSYGHIATSTNALISEDDFPDMIENLGDAYEAVEEMYGMIWYLADGDPARVDDAWKHFEDGLRLSPTDSTEVSDG